MPHFLHKGNEWGWMNRLLNVNSCAFFILISNFQLYPPLYLASLSQILIMSFLGFYGIKMCIFILTSFFIYFKLWFPLFSNIIYHICFYFPFSPYCIFSCSYCPWSYCSFWVFCLFVLTILLWSLKKSTIFISKTSWYAIIRRRQWHPTPVLLPGKSHGWRSLGKLRSMGSWRVGHEWATSLSLFTLMQWRRKWQPTPVFLPGESQGWGSLVGFCLWGHTESDTTEAT